MRSYPDVASSALIPFQIEFYAYERRFPEELDNAFRLVRVHHEPVVLLVRNHHNTLLALPCDPLRTFGSSSRNTSLNLALAVWSCQSGNPVLAMLAWAGLIPG